VKQAQVLLNEKEIMQEILALPQKQAEEWGVDRKTFQTTKKEIREALITCRKINLLTPARKRLVERLCQ
jgi:hypothetical protein